MLHVKSLPGQGRDLYSMNGHVWFQDRTCCALAEGVYEKAKPGEEPPRIDEQAEPEFVVVANGTVYPA